MVEHPCTEPDHDHTDQPTPEEQPQGLLYISDVQALRCAEAVSFHASDGAGFIHASLTALTGDQPRIYTAKEQHLFGEAVDRDRRRRIDVAADIVGYDARRRWHERQLPGATAFASIGGAQFEDVWRSVAGFLRADDVVHLRWRADNNTDQLIARGLHRDELSILVQRGKRLWTFLLDVSVRPSDARMVTGPARR